jgi:hypothetical protein
MKKLVELLPHSALISAALAVQGVQAAAAAAAAAEQICCLVEELVGTMYLLTDRVPNSELQQVQLLPAAAAAVVVCCLFYHPLNPRKKRKQKRGKKKKKNGAGEETNKITDNAIARSGQTNQTS